jgi:hypothetical protein
VSTPTPAPAFRAGRGLAYLGGFAACGAGLSALFALTGAGLPCPFLLATGWDCPLCGGTRLGAALLHGDVAAAFAFNPLVSLSLAVLTVLGVLWTIEVLGGPVVRLPARAAVPLASVRPSQWLVLGAVVAAVFVVSRNLL